MRRRMVLSLLSALLLVGLCGACGLSCAAVAFLHGAVLTQFVLENLSLYEELDKRVPFLERENAAQKFVLSCITHERDALRLEVDGLRLLRRRHHHPPRICTWSECEWTI